MFFNNDKIEFIIEPELHEVLPEPVPANKHIPEWFRKIPLKTEQRTNTMPGATAKKCLPMLDAMTLGYIVPLQGDVHVITNDDCSVLSAEHMQDSTLPFVERHSFSQLKSTGWKTGKQDPLKFINYYGIKTPPGWSCLFQPLPSVWNLPYTVLSGVVDTDQYHSPVNFPVIWHQPNFDDTLLAGMPLVHVVPFKRQKHKHIIRPMNEKECKQRDKLNVANRTRLGTYTKELREIR